MKKLIAILFILGFLFYGKSAYAKSPVYPIADLGGCRDAKECYLYCQVEENKPACWSYGTYVLSSDVLGDETASGSGSIKSGITFPIPELGNCTSVDSCKAYCDNPLYKDACISFARNHGIGQYKEDKDKLDHAKTELGCSTFESCRILCESPDNKRQCQAFKAKYVDPIQKSKEDSLLLRAKTILGCDSIDACKALCQDPINHEKCANFTKSVSTTNTSSLQQKLGCTTESECKSICAAHPDLCPGFRTAPLAKPSIKPSPISSPYIYTQPAYPEVTATPGAQYSTDQINTCIHTEGCYWTGSSCLCTNSH